MQNYNAKFKMITLLTLVMTLGSPLASIAFDQNTSESYLLAHSNSPWATMGLTVLGTNDIPTNHLKSTTSNSAIDYTAPILAITALGENPRTFGSQDYVAALKNFHQQNQIGDVSLINDDIFGILALISAGESKTDQVISDAKNFILAQQNADHGWGFAVNSDSDTNTTAAAILALLSAGEVKTSAPIQNALAYLQSAQNSDGGITYDPQSPWGTDSDSSSTAWVIWALNALDINPASWNKSGNNPTTYLESSQTAAGYFSYQPGSAEDAFSAVTTAYAVIALSGKSLPLQIFSNNTEQFEFRIEGSSEQICAGRVPGPTALDIVKNASLICGFTYNIQETSFGPYLDRINSDEASGMTGWLYFVNNILPNIGAADYVLITGDSILWRFGSGESKNASINLSVAVDAGQIGGETEEPPETISFTVNPGSLDFGELEPGQSASRQLQLANNGTVNIDIESIVSGDDLLTQNLKLDSDIWSRFQTELPAAQASDHTATLAIPSSYSVSGAKAGTLTFWAIAN